MKNELATIILAAGKGTRMNSELPKVLHKVGQKTMLAHVIGTSKIIGSKKIVSVIGYKHEMVRNAMSDQKIEFVLQLEQLGTAHAVMQCSNILNDFNGNILILYGDVPMITANTLLELISYHEREHALCTILTTDLPNPTGYGRVIKDEYDSLLKIVEEKDANDEERKIKEVNSGFYVFQASTLFRLLPKVGNDNKQNEYYLPDVINLIIKEKGKVSINKINDYVEIQGINNLEQLHEINDLYEKQS